MNIRKIQEFLGWCTVINFIFLILAGLTFFLAHDWMYQFHQAFLNVSVETYDSLWFITLAFFKILVIVFNLIPYCVLRFISNKNI
jgi:hypothetical protein